MMRMLAWVNLLANDGLVNKALGLGIFDVHINWLSGRSVVVVLGLVYGYVPYMILPLYAGLDRLPQSTLEAARDLGANRVSAFVRVVLPMCRSTIVAAVLLTCLPMLGDYFTNDLLSGSPQTVDGRQPDQRDGADAGPDRLRRRVRDARPRRLAACRCSTTSARSRAADRVAT